MKVALIQLDIVWESKKANYEKAEFFVKKASEEKCDVAVLPEMFNTGFSMNLQNIAEEDIGETDSVLSEMAEKYGIHIIAGVPVKDSGEKKGRNTAVVYNRKGVRIASYTKIHPFSFLKEDEYYIAGNDTVTFDIDGTASSIFICYDLRFPEIFRKIAKDVQTIFVVANWPASRREHWETLLKARAIENQCFVIGVNRTGTDGNGIHYPGASHIFDPLGNDILCGGEKEELLIGAFNPDEVNEVRSKFPFLRDMKISSYDPLAHKGV